MTVMALIISDLDGYYAPQPCGQIDSMLRGNRTEVLAVFPQCQSFYSGENPGQWAIAQANLKTDNDAFSAAALGTSCGAAAWLALAIHAIGVELYVSLTVLVCPNIHRLRTRVGLANSCVSIVLAPTHTGRARETKKGFVSEAARGGYEGPWARWNHGRSVRRCGEVVATYY